jgi:hypothetical protein
MLNLAMLGLLALGSVGAAQAAKPDEAKGGRDTGAERHEMHDQAREQRREDCRNSSEHECTGLQTGLEHKPASPGKAAGSQGYMTGMGHERGDEPGRLKGNKAPQ